MMLHGDGVSLLGDEIVWELDDGNICKTLNILNIYLIYIGISNGKFCVIQFYNNKKNVNVYAIQKIYYIMLKGSCTVPGIWEVVI